jgi:RNA polymerase sigma factor (sigma-70 family)
VDGTGVVAEVGSALRDREREIRAFCEAEYAALARYCHRIESDPQLARDVAQEAFVRLFGRWTHVREPRAYLYLVATNLLRREVRRRRTEVKALTVAYPRTEHVQGPEPGIRDAVERLPRRWRDVVLLHYYADLSLAEVARQLHQSERMVKRRLHEARELLAKTLGERP